MDHGLISLIKETYPISFITTVGSAYGLFLCYFPYSKVMRSYERALGLREK